MATFKSLDFLEIDIRNEAYGFNSFEGWKTDNWISENGLRVGLNKGQNVLLQLKETIQVNLHMNVHVYIQLYRC